MRFVGHGLALLPGVEQEAGRLLGGARRCAVRSRGERVLGRRSTGRARRVQTRPRFGLGFAHARAAADVRSEVEHALGTTERIRGFDLLSTAIEREGQDERGREEHRQNHQLFEFSHRTIDLRSDWKGT